MKHSLSSAVCIAAVVMLGVVPGVSAEEEGQASVEKSTWEQVLEMYERAKEMGEQVPQDVYEWVRQDIGKIGDWEYLVDEIPIANPAAAEKRLNELGADRWECIWVHSSGGKTSIILKRPSRSYLKQLPLSQLMRLFPREDSGEAGE